MTTEGLNYCLQLPGWCDQEKMLELIKLVKQTAINFPDKQLLSVDCGTFGGRSLFPMAAGHASLNRGTAIGIDAYSNPVTLEGTNHPENDKYWSKMDFASIERVMRTAMEYPEWKGFVKFLKGKSIDFAKEFADEQITLFHQDSGHNVETITAELEAWAPKVAIGGYWVADDVLWVEAKPGYAKLPSFGFELVKDYGTWAVYKKAFQPSIVKGDTMFAGMRLHNQDGSKTDTLFDKPINLDKPDNSDTWPVSGKVKIENEKMPEGGFKVEAKGTDFFPVSQPASGTKEVEISGRIRHKADAEKAEFPPNWDNMIDYMGTVLQSNQTASPIQFDKFKIMPTMIVLPDTKYWRGRAGEGLAYFYKQGIHPYLFTGIHAKNFGIQGRHIYLRDNPAEQFYIGDGKVGGMLTINIQYNVMAAMNYTHFLTFEDDARFHDGWFEKVNQALNDIPADFDYLFLESCCAEDKQPVHVKGDLYHYPKREGLKGYYPMGGSSVIIAKKALPVLLSVQRQTASPGDVNLCDNAFDRLNVFAILPRVGFQQDTELVK